MREPIHPVQLEAPKKATPAEKLERVARLREAGIRLRIEGLRMAHPDCPAQKLARKARRSLLRAGA